MKKFALLMLVILVGVSVIAAGCGGDNGGDAAYADGTYTGEGQGISVIKVEVTVADGEITGIDVVEEDETPDIGGVAFEDLVNAALEAQSADIDAISGATITSKGFMDAVEDALSGAK